MTDRAKARSLQNCAESEPVTYLAQARRTDKLCYSPKLAADEGYAPSPSASKTSVLLLHQSAK